MSRHEFWGSTPREVYAEFEAASQRGDDRHDRDVVLAWRIVHIWARTKAKNRMPALKPMLRTAARDRRPPSHAEQLAVLHVLSAQYGIPLARRRVEASRAR